MAPAPSSPAGGRTIPELTLRLRKFAEARGWDKVHEPKNLLLALTAELGELTDLFSWQPANQVQLDQPVRRAAVEDELADVFIYLLRLADVLDVDLAAVADAKIDRNEHRFPRG